MSVRKILIGAFAFNPITAPLVASAALASKIPVPRLKPNERVIIDRNGLTIEEVKNIDLLKSAAVVAGIGIVGFAVIKIARGK